MVEFLTHGKEAELLKHTHTRGQSDACIHFFFFFSPFLFPNAMLPGSLLMTKYLYIKKELKVATCSGYKVKKKKNYPIITCFLYAFVAIKKIICEDKAILSQPREKKNRCVKGIGINVWSFLCNAEF